jgi:ankyrin repeat protein
LHSAASYGKFEVVHKLIEDDADINARDKPEGGWTGDHLKDGSVLRLLLEFGTKINVWAADGSAPLHRASENEALEVVDLLLEHGAYINVVNYDGKDRSASCGQDTIPKGGSGTM